MSKTRIDWLDAAKTVAIIAVLLDHTYSILYTNGKLWVCSFFNVPLFIWIMGITFFVSYQKSGVTVWNVVRKCLSMIIPYIICVVLSEPFMYKPFRFDSLFYHLGHFDEVPAHYYALLYVQLALVSPLLYLAVKSTAQNKYRELIRSAILVGTVIIAVFSMKYIHFLNPYPAGTLFGATYFTILYLGMWFADEIDGKEISCKKAAVTGGGSLAAFVAVSIFISQNQFRLDALLGPGNPINPPRISTPVQSFLMLITVFCTGKVIEKRKTMWPKKVFHYLAVPGRYTLFVFLYHQILLNFLGRAEDKFGITFPNLASRALVYLPVIIVGPIVLEILYRKVVGIVKVKAKKK